METTLLLYPNKKGCRAHLISRLRLWRYNFFYWCSVDLRYFQVYNIYVHYEVITTLSFSYLLLLYKVITALLTIFPMLFVTSLWLIYFIIESFYYLIPFTFFTHHPAPIPRATTKFVLCIYESVCFVFFRFHM